MKTLGVLAMAAFLVVVAVAGVAAQDTSDGQAVYETSCSSCHQPGGTGLAGVFPPLAGNPNVADAAYVEEVIRAGRSGPIEVLGETYDSPMAAIPLDDADVAAVVLYVQSLSGAPDQPTTTAAPPAVGDAARGERLFNGAAGFEARGPACAACHSAGSAASNGGAGLGPDLTNTYQTLGSEAGLTAWLASTAAYPGVMGPVFADKDLTETEIADLVAFLATTPGDGAPGRAAGWAFAGLGAAVGVALLILMALVIRGPNTTYNDRLRSGNE